MKLLACIGVDPGLIRVRLRSPGMNIPPNLGVGPEARQKSAENDLIRLSVGRGEKLANVVMAGRRKGRLRERFKRDAKLLEERAVQRAFDNNRHFGGLGELDDAVRGGGFRGRQGQGAPEPDEVVGVLRNVVPEPRLAEHARRKLRIERHGPDCLVKPGIAGPRLA
jgi:hypothetical protein